MAYDDYGQIHHDHHYVRKSLELLRTAVSSHLAPPNGHAFWQLLEDAARFFGGELPQHIRFEEETIFPRFDAESGRDELAGLRDDHVAILAQAAALSELVASRDARGDEAAWALVRARARALESALEDHMIIEDRVLRQLARQGAAGSDARSVS